MKAEGTCELIPGSASNRVVQKGIQEAFSILDHFELFECPDQLVVWPIIWLEDELCLHLIFLRGYTTTHIRDVINKVENISGFPYWWILNWFGDISEWQIK